MRSLFFVALLILLTHYSCREIVTDEFPGFTPVPAVNRIIIAGEPVKVHISLAEKLDTNQLTLVKDADISLYIDGNYAENLFPDENGIYFSSSVVEPLRSYKLEVNIPGYKSITCNEILPSPSPIFNIIHTSNAGKDEEGMIYPSVTLSFKTNPAERQYYEIVIRTFQFGYERLATLKKITDPVLLNEGLPLTIFSNEIIRDSVYTMTINYFTGSAGFSGNEPYHTSLYPMIIELRSCSGDYYRFVKQKHLYEKGRFPEFLAASTNAFPLFSNIPGGYGIFAGYSVVISDTLFPKF
ncbi:MAG: DUF4249 domain-containing protein [Bacteroidales bacterium]|nr:DUF4249 domain-containing protein [Bacteroidales bacterium]